MEKSAGWRPIFTATSAVTITGLSVVNVGEAYTVSGQIVIMFLLQCGGLGFMTFAILAVMSLAPQLGLKQTSHGTGVHWTNQSEKSQFYH